MPALHPRPLGALAAPLCLALCLALPPAARAQAAPKGEEPAPPLPTEYSDAARRDYAQGLAEARGLMREKRYDDAIAKLDRLSELRPREPHARFLKAVALADLGRTDEAIATLRAIVADYPELPEPRNNLAVLYAGKGSLALARDELELAIAAAPDYAIAHENLGDVYVRLAVTHYERAAALEKDGKTAPQKLKLARELAAAAR